MEQYIARQPILNAHQKLFAYELLYRGAHDYLLSNVSGNKATTNLLSIAFLTKDIKEISSHRPCFINFTQELIEKKIPSSFPESLLVIEILEDVKPTKKVLSVCRELKDKGYRIALDDFIFDRKLIPLVELAHIIKIDVRLTPLDTILETINKLSSYKVKLLAEKVETRKEFDLALKLGFSYFQGYYFSKPEKIGIEELSSAKVNMLRLLSEVSQKATTLNKLHTIISADIAISYKLLRFLNSAYFYRLQKVRTVKHAMAYLGEKELRRFLMLVIISEFASDKPDELVKLVLVRAKFCELLGEVSPHASYSAELFMMGLFSALDTMLDSPMERVMEKLPISDNIKLALLQGTGVCAQFLQAAIVFERNQQAQMEIQFNALGVPATDIPGCYLAAVKYTNGLV
jgi:c-di-GMP-related signal transduction protein